MEWLETLAKGLGLAALVGIVVQWIVDRRFRQWEVRFSKLYERRVEVMEGILDRLVELKRALDRASGIQPLDDPDGMKPLHNAADAGNEAWRYLAARRFYLPKEVADKIDGLLKEAREAWSYLATAAGGRAYDASPVYSAMRSGGYKTVRERLPPLIAEMPPLIAEIEEEFRRVLEGRRPAGWWQQWRRPPAAP